MSHVSVRVAWHDTDWTGRVCAEPGANYCCTILKNVKENKIPLRKRWSPGAHGRSSTTTRRASTSEPASCGPRRSRRSASTNYAWNRRGAHAHFAPTIQRMPPYSLEVTPFRWVMLHEYERYATPWGIRVDMGLEERAHELMRFNEDTWIQDHRNHLALLDSFFSALRPRTSLVFLYAKDIPLVEEREPGERYLIGAGFVESVDPAVEWSYSEDGPLHRWMEPRSRRGERSTSQAPGRRPATVDARRAHVMPGGEARHGASSLARIAAWLAKTKSSRRCARPLQGSSAKPSSTTSCAGPCSWEEPAISQTSSSKDRSVG